jgi:aminoglycoside/choline kinase family phosphotransferase
MIEPSKQVSAIKLGPLMRIFVTRYCTATINCNGLFSNHSPHSRNLSQHRRLVSNPHMTAHSDESILQRCYRAYIGSSPTSMSPLKPHASDRRIYRIMSSSGESLVGVVNDSSAENRAFVYLARFFSAQGLPVPTIYHFDEDELAYLVEDLGDQTLRDLLDESRRSSNEPFPQIAEHAYKQALTHLTQFQISASKKLDYSRCYPESCFSPAALMTDMQAFSLELVKRLIPEFDTSKLLPEYSALIEFLSGAKSDYFLYRDFQSRNIMMKGGNPHYIDFQGGRKGPLQYDVVSLLYQSSAQLPQSVRDQLLDFYLQTASQVCEIDGDEFRSKYGGFIISRMLQVLGVYGRQGLGAGKEYFRSSIPEALKTLREQLRASELPQKFPTLSECVERLEQVSVK